LQLLIAEFISSKKQISKNFS